MKGSGREAAWRSFQAFLSKLVVSAALLGVAQNLVGLRDLLEALLSAAGLVLVRVVLESHLTVCLLDVILGGIFADAEHCVVVLSHDE